MQRGLLGVKIKRTSQYANEHGLPRPDSACFEHGGGSRSNRKGEYVVLIGSTDVGLKKGFLPRVTLGTTLNQQNLELLKGQFYTS